MNTEDDGQCKNCLFSVNQLEQQQQLQEHRFFTVDNVQWKQVFKIIGFMF